MFPLLLKATRTSDSLAVVEETGKLFVKVGRVAARSLSSALLRVPARALSQRRASVLRSCDHQRTARVSIRSPELDERLFHGRKSATASSSAADAKSASGSKETEDMLRLRVLSLCTEVALTSPEAFAAYQRAGTLLPRVPAKNFLSAH